MLSKKKVRCYKILAQVASNVDNYPVFVLYYEGWSNISLATCICCEELFVIDWENLKTQGLTNIANVDKCPKCNSPLKDTLREYPKTIKLPNGQLGSFSPDNGIPSDKDSLIVEFFEIIPDSSF